MGGRQAARGCARRRSSCGRACRPTPRRARRVFAVFDGHDAAGRGALDRRGVPRRARPASGSRARRAEIAVRLRRAVRERVGLPITVGVARTKFLAKVASGVAKPDGLLVVPPDGELAFLHPLPVERLWGVGAGDRGQAARARASRRSARSRGWTRPRWSTLLGAGVGPAPARARAQPRPAAGAGRPPAAARSARSARSAARRRSAEEIDATLVGLVDRVTRRMRAARRVGRTVVLRLRFDDFTRATRSHTLPHATAETQIDPRHGARAARGRDAADRAPRPHAGRRRGRQPRRRPAPSSSRCRSTAHSGGALDAALDAVRDRFGSAAVTRAVLLGRDAGPDGAAAARLTGRRCGSASGANRSPAAISSRPSRTRAEPGVRAGGAAAPRRRSRRSAASTLLTSVSIGCILLTSLYLEYLEIESVAVRFLDVKQFLLAS